MRQIIWPYSTDQFLQNGVEFMIIPESLKYIKRVTTIESFHIDLKAENCASLYLRSLKVKILIIWASHQLCKISSKFRMVSSKFVKKALYMDMDW